MGIMHSVFRSLGCKVEDEERSIELDRYRKPCNGGFSRASLCNIFKNLWPWICSFLLFVKSKKQDPVLPVENPVLYPILQISESSLPSSDSAGDSRPVAKYVRPPHVELQMVYSIPENESHVNAATFVTDLELQRDFLTSDNEECAIDAITWQQKPPDSSAVLGSVRDENSNFTKQKQDVIIDVASLGYYSVYRRSALDVAESSVLVENEQQNPCPNESLMNTEEEEKVIKCLEPEGKWIRHYNSHHRILLVGEGDFSFSACLAVAFGSASNMIATSLDSRGFLQENYKNSMSNIRKLRSRECKVMHGIDATEIANHHLLGGMTFDRIIFNFPHAGTFSQNSSRKTSLRKHRRLVSLFMKNAKEMIDENGEIHVSHKTNGFHKEWKLESLASSHRLRLIEAGEFSQEDYPGYDTKYGFGGDKNFKCYPSKTYKFGLKTAKST